MSAKTSSAQRVAASAQKAVVKRKASSSRSAATVKPKNAGSAKRRATGKAKAGAESRASKAAATTAAATPSRSFSPLRPTRGGFLVVGVGASAGGLEALEELLRNMPNDTGMAFVIISHQHPGHSSLLPELLGKCTGMSVVEAGDGARLEPDHVYVGPPGGHVAVMKGVLHLMEGPKGEMPPLPIDFFFRSLAQDQRGRAVCIVLSGTGTDGTLGLRAVKGEAGMAMAQEIHSARYAGMPASAIGTTLADYVLPPAAMPAQLVAYARTTALRGPGTLAAVSAPGSLEQPILKVCALLRARTGHDFSSYKPNTLQRRIERRMMVHEIVDPDRYVHLLRENPHEIDILFKELLIGVTSFFRDPEAFQALAERALPELMNSRPDNYTFRVWIPGCGSGEEAYTVAILLRQCMRMLGKAFAFQVFATDLDAEAIEVARGGQYPPGITADVPSELLQRCFMQEDGGMYRVRKEIREMLVFAPQNVIRDPPFTRLDLLCCRNLLIYLNADLQRRLLPIFHYALNSEGLLMLGPSETIGQFSDLFAAVDKTWKLFKRRETVAAHALPRIPAQPVPRAVGTVTEAQLPRPDRPVSIASHIEKLMLSRFAPATVVVNERGDIVYIHGRTGAYLEPPSGQPSINIHAMAREGLSLDLASAMRQALAGDNAVVRRRIRVKTNGDHEYVDLSVAKITEPETVRGLLLVTFVPVAPQPAVKAPRKKTGGKIAGHASAARVQALEREVRYTRESLQTTVEELETSIEELKSSNEELQSTNEELQSTNEELETSKEEMQSLNEELTTVNAELQAKLDELSRANDDMQNLLNSTDTATLFLDADLKIKRYTDQVKRLINVIPTDIGRLVADLVTDLRYDRLAADCREVLNTLERKEMEVESREGSWFLMRILPYRTADNVIDGLVVTFVNISRTKQAESAGRQLLQDAFDTVREPVLLLDAELRVLKGNRAFYRTFSADAETTEGRLIYRLGGGEWDVPKLRELLEDILPAKSTIEGFEVATRFPTIGERTFKLSARRLERGSGMPGMILLAMEDATEG